MRIDLDTHGVSGSGFVHGAGTLDHEPVTVFATDPVIQARDLVSVWYAHYSGFERLSDSSPDMRWLSPWADDLAILDVVDRGTDFRIRLATEKVTKFFDDDRFPSRLSDLSSPYRQALRQILLRALVTRSPAVEEYDWLVDAGLRSCLACAMPIAGGLYQPSQMLLVVLPRRLTLSPDAVDLPPAGPRILNGLA